MYKTVWIVVVLLVLMALFASLASAGPPATTTSMSSTFSVPSFDGESKACDGRMLDGRRLSQHERFLLTGRTAMPTAVDNSAERKLMSAGEHVAIREREEIGVVVLARTWF